MKKITNLKFMILSIMCFLGSSLFAVSVSNFTEFDAALNSLKTSGGGTIELTADINIPLTANSTYSLSSTAANPIVIHTGAFSITGTGTGTTADEAYLEVGDNVSIEGTATVLRNAANSKIRIVGGSVKSVATVPSSTIFAQAGWAYISGGEVIMDATGSTGNSFAINMANYFTLNVTGGTISAIGAGTRAVRISDGTANISGAAINADGGTGTSYALLALGSNLMVIGNDVTINTTTTADAGLVSGGAASRVYIPATVTNLNITSNTKYKLDNPTAELIDFRGLTLIANPISGTAFTDPADVTFTLSGNESAALTKLYYNYSADPTAASPSISSGGNVLASAANTNIRITTGKPDATYNSTVHQFNYTVANPSGPKMVNTFADLQAAYNASQTGAAGTTEIKFLGNITVPSNFTMTPSSTHPVVIDANGFQLINGSGASSTHTLTLGGNLTMSSTTNTGLIRVNGQTTTNITGGTYTVNGNAPVIYALAGSGINNATTKINLSNATFNANGTSAAANIVGFSTSDGNSITADNCTFNVSAGGTAFRLIGPQFINIHNSTLNFAGNNATSIAFSQAPTNAVNKSDLVIDGLTLNMEAGNIFAWGGNKNINSVILDMEQNGAAVLEKPTTGTGTVKNLYDFRAFTSEADPAGGAYTSAQNVTLSLKTTEFAPIDATGATIVYTTDGSNPVATSTAYTSIITVSNAITMKVSAIKDGFVGKPVSFVYDVATSNKDLSSTGFTIYPTIVKDILKISQKVENVRVLDLSGKLVIEKQNVSELNISNLESGVYIVKVGVENSFRIFKK